jgi:hypothetical protein
VILLGVVAGDPAGLDFVVVHGRLKLKREKLQESSYLPLKHSTTTHNRDDSKIDQTKY